MSVVGFVVLVTNVLPVLLQALNNLQSTHSGFGFINSQNVFKVCDEPHPLLVKGMLGRCVEGDVDGAYKVVEELWALGYSPEDIMGNIFRVCKTYQMPEYLKLEFIKVGTHSFTPPNCCCSAVFKYPCVFCRRSVILT